MKSKITFLLTLSILLLSRSVVSQNFEGRLVYEAYKISQGDTIVFSRLTYWIKDHLYKHQVSLSSMPLTDLGTLYANADKMTRNNISESGTVEVIKMSLDADIPNIRIEATDKNEIVLGYNCKIWKLIDNKSNKTLSKLWVSEELRNDYFNEFARLFNYKNTSFPCEGLNGWILKHEAYRKDGEVLVSEVKEIEKTKLSVADMMIY